MTNNNAQVVFSIRDDATKTIRQVEKNVIASTKNMTAEEAKYAREIVKTQTRVFELKQEMATASKERIKDIRQEISALNGLQTANRKAYSEAKTTANAGKGKGKFMEAVDQSPLGGMVGLMSNPYVAVGTAAVAAGTAIYNITEKVLASQDIWRQRVQGTEADYEKLGESTLKISNVFGKNNDEIVRAGNAFAKSFGVDAKDALDVMYEGFKKGADMNGLFLDNLAEYSVQAKEAGMSTEEFVGFLINAEKQGIYSDKGIDVIKEGGLRLRENTKATKDALKPLKDEVELQIKNKIAAGDTFGAMKLISGELNKGYLNAQQMQTIIADVFGGPGEDAGLPFLKSLEGINNELSDIPSNLSESQKATIALKEEWSLFESGIGSVFDEAIIGIKTAIISVIKFIKDNAEVFAILNPAYYAKLKAMKIVEEAKQAEKEDKDRRGKMSMTDLLAAKKLSEKQLKENAVGSEAYKYAEAQLRKINSDIVALDAKQNASKTEDKTKDDKTKTKGSGTTKTDKIDKTEESKTKSITDRTTNLSESKVVRSLTINIENALNIEQLNGKIDPKELALKVSEAIGREVGKANDFAGKA